MPWYGVPFRSTPHCTLVSPASLGAVRWASLPETGAEGRPARPARPPAGALAYGATSVRFDRGADGRPSGVDRAAARRAGDGTEHRPLCPDQQVEHDKGRSDRIQDGVESGRLRAAARLGCSWFETALRRPISSGLKTKSTAETCEQILMKSTIRWHSPGPCSTHSARPPGFPTPRLSTRASGGREVPGHGGPRDRQHPDKGLLRPLAPCRAHALRRSAAQARSRRDEWTTKPMAADHSPLGLGSRMVTLPPASSSSEASC
jgi:hypothetical protein